MTHVVAGFGLDLDYIGAEQRELVGAERPRDIAGEIEDANAGEGFGHGFFSIGWIDVKASFETAASRPPQDDGLL